MTSQLCDSPPQCPEASQDDADSCINSLSSASEADSSQDVDPERLPPFKEFNTLQTPSATNPAKAKPEMVRTVASSRATGDRSFGPGRRGGGPTPPPYRPSSIPPYIQGRMKKARRRDLRRNRAAEWNKHPAIPYNEYNRFARQYAQTLPQRYAAQRQRAAGTASSTSSSISSSSLFERSLRR